MRIKSLKDLKELKNKVKADIDLRGGPKEIRITVHMGTCGIAAGARDILSQLIDELSTASIDNVTLRQTGCIGLCDQEPMISLTDNSGTTFRYVRLDKIKIHEIVQDHLLGGNPVTSCLIKE
jgi:(2Fe-2S) ferredoxin